MGRAPLPFSRRLNMAQAKKPVKGYVASEWFYRRELYKEATVNTGKDNPTNVLIAENVGCKGVWLRFTRRVESWEVRLTVEVSLDGEKWYRYHTGIKATDEVIEFYEFLQMKASGSWRSEAESVYTEVKLRLGVSE
jgi:hypothetical protein